MLRAFVAIKLAPQIIEQVDAAIAKLRTSMAGVHWVDTDNIHLTLKFLGNIEDSQVEPIERALAARLKVFSRFTINAKGLGVFPGVRRPRILWVGIDQPRLAELALSVEAALVPLGFAPEQRGFQPHLTIGRFRQFESSAKQLSGQLERWKDQPFGSCDVREVTLFQSLLKPDGALHNPLRTIALADHQPLI